MAETKDSTRHQTPERLRLLLATERDALAEAVLIRVGAAFEVVSERVTNQAALAAALGREAWDVVVCDPGSAGSDCHWASTLGSHGGDTLRVLAVALEEDNSRAGELLRAGARAALGPSQFGHIVPVVERELADARAQRTRSIESIVKHAPDPILIVDAEGRIQRASVLAQSLLGYSEAELAGRPVEVLIPEARRGRHAARRAGYMEMPRFRAMGAGMEFPALAKDGTEIPVEISLAPLALRGATLVVCAMRDLRARLSRLAPLLTFSPDPVLIVGTNGRIVRANRMLLELLGYAEEELIGEPIERLVPESLRAAHVARRTAYLAAPVPRPMASGLDFSAVAKDGRLVPVEISLSPVQVDGERMIACALRDLRERRRTERLTRAILEGTGAETGEAFMRSLVRNLAQALEVHMAVVVEFVGPEKDRAKVLAAWAGGEFAEPFECPTAGTPCGVTGTAGEWLVAEGARALYPGFGVFERVGAESYFGMRIGGRAGEPLGLLAVVHTAKFPDEQATRTVLGAFAARAGAELERKNAEQALAQREAELRESSERNRQILDNVDEIVYMVDIDPDDPFRGKVRLVSGRVKHILGYDAEEFIADQDLWSSIVHAEDLVALGQQTQAMIASGDPATREYRVLSRLTGGYRWLEDRVTPQRDAAGHVVSLFGVARDVTEARSAAQAARESEQRFRATFEQAAVGMAQVAPDGRWLRVNQALCDILGYTRKELLALRFQDIVHAEDLDADPGFLRRAAAGTRPTLSMAMRCIRKDGSAVHTHLTASLVREAQGQPDYFIFVIQDVTLRKRAEEALREGAERLRLVADNVPAMILYTDAEHRVLYANRQFAEFYTGVGVVPQGRALAEVLGAESWSAARPNIERALTGKTVVYAARRRDAAGEWRDIDAVLRPHRDGSGAVVGIYTFIQDVTEERNAARSAQESRERLQLVADNVPAMIAYVDRDLRYRFANRSLGALFGRTPDELLGHEVREVAGERVWEEVRGYIERALAGESVSYTREERLPDGSLRQIQGALVPERANDGSVGGYYAMMIDVTESKRTEQDLARFRAAMDHSGDAILLIDRASMRYIDVNRTCCELIGYTREEMLGKTPMDVFSADRATLERDYDAIIRDKDSAATKVEGWYRRKDGTEIPIESRRRALRSGDGWIMVVTARDITARRASEAALRLRNRALESSVNAVMITEGEAKGFRLVYVNPAFERITGYTTAEALGRNPRFLRREDDGQAALEELKVAAREGREGTVVLRNYHKDGTLFWNELHIAPVRDESAAVTHFVGISADVTDRVRYQEELERHANYDTLTGLPNRNLVRDRLEQAIAQATRTGSIAAAMYVDLDHFKRINDSLGHAVGDQVIAAIGARLAGAMRSGDTVARMGGDEFVVVLADLKREEDAGRVGQKLREVVAMPLAVGAHEFVLSLSVGVAVSPKDGTDGATLLRGADAALYRAKGDGRDCLRFFTAELNARALRFVGIERDLRRALEQGELTLHYQPIIRLRTGELVGAEALARWRRSDGSMVPPAEFIPVAEESGLIIALGRWIIESAARQAAAWNAPGRERLVISVNLSARQFRDPDLVELVRGAIQAAGVEPALLKFEITESAVMREADRAIETLRALKGIGVQLSVDDFGTGYSSLAYLKRFPVDTLKLDRSFVSGLPDDADDLAISRGIIDLAHGLDLEVIAEGIETRAQAETLARLGCESAQGYLFGRPVEPQAFDHAPRAKGPAAKRRKRTPRVRR